MPSQDPFVKTMTTLTAGRLLLLHYPAHPLQRSRSTGQLSTPAVLSKGLPAAPTSFARLLTLNAARFQRGGEGEWCVDVVSTADGMYQRHRPLQASINTTLSERRNTTVSNIISASDCGPPINIMLTENSNSAANIVCSDTTGANDRGSSC
ncbi:uncharacterized protein LOC143025237 [Oratosquilla oratoria]|uniref:uncharacterized protein LOC143025237 n=1 Tax=Oratosquilla oratoria TaxID=337810 RepID=UPI003F75C8E2